MKLRIGTRGSMLARAQSELVANSLKRQLGAGFEAELVEIVTHGDVTPGSLVGLSETGVFVTALRNALLDDQCDVLVHSLKDMPVADFDGLHIAAIPTRGDSRDALCASGSMLADLDAGARVGTSSPRRAAQLKALRPDLDVVDVRGNVDSRLARIGHDFEAVVVAYAGLQRLDREDQADEIFEPDIFVPAPGQGALAIEARDDAPPELRSALARLDDMTTRARVTAERAALAVLQGGCSAPVGVHATALDGALTVRARVIRADGSLALNEVQRGPLIQAERIGRTVGHALLGRGAQRLMTDGGA